MKADRYIFLMGRPPMSEALGFFRTQPVVPITNMKQISDDWRKANDHVKELMEEEKNICDSIEITPIDSKFDEKISATRENSIFQKSFEILPTEFKMVEIDKLVIYQKTVNLDFVDELKKEFPTKPNDDFLFDFCLGPRKNPPVSANRIGQNAMQFTSVSRDFRFLGEDSLDIDKMKWYKSSGHFTSVIGLFIGYGSNFVNALNVGKRLILHNGMHRTYTLRKMGYTHMPCLIQQISRKEEYGVTILGSFSEEVRNELIESTRPVLMKDFFDSLLMKKVMLSKKITTVRIGW